MKDNDGWAPVTNSPQVIQPVTTPVLEENEDWSVENAYNPSQPRDDRGRWGEGGFGGKESIQQGRSPGSAGRSTTGEDFRRVKEDYGDDDEEVFKEFQEYKKFKQLKGGIAAPQVAGAAGKGGGPGDPEKTLPADGEDGGGKGKGTSSIDGQKPGAPPMDDKTKAKANTAMNNIMNFLAKTASTGMSVAATVAKKSGELLVEGTKMAYHRYGNFGSVATFATTAGILSLIGTPAVTAAAFAAGAMEARKIVKTIADWADGPSGKGPTPEDSLLGDWYRPRIGSTRIEHQWDDNRRTYNAAGDVEQTDAEQMAQAGPIEIPEGLAEHILQFVQSYCAELKLEPPSVSLDDVKEMLATLANHLSSDDESEGQDGEEPVDPEEMDDQDPEEEPMEDEDVSEEDGKPDWLKDDSEEEQAPPKKPVGNISYYGPGW